MTGSRTMTHDPPTANAPGFPITNPSSRDPKSPLRTTHLITTLDADGAQLALARVLRQLGDRASATDVISLTPEGRVAEILRESGIRVRSLGMRGGIDTPAAIVKLARWLRRERPQVFVTWLYHANLLGSLAARLGGQPPVVWNIAHGNFEPQHAKRQTGIVIRLGAQLARRAPRQIVFCSSQSRTLHCRHGYPAERSILIPNGFELNRFRPSPGARRDVRRELRLPADAPLIGLVGRFHPDKDHETFAEAAGRVATHRPDVRFLLCGRGISTENGPLMRMLGRAGVTPRCRLLGPRDDVPRVMAALDVYVSSSATEAFPLVLGEAMASGVPCAVTDVGDSAVVVGDSGRLVPPREPAALADACLDLLALPREARHDLGRLARIRIARHFDLRRTAERHHAVWLAAAGANAAGQPSLRTNTCGSEREAA